MREEHPELTWTPGTPHVRDSDALNLDGKVVTLSRMCPDLIQALQKAKNFSPYALFVRQQILKDPMAESFQFRNRDGFSNLSLRQRDGNLVFWFRNPLSVRRDQLPLNIPDVFAFNQPRDILVSYDRFESLGIY